MVGAEGGYLKRAIVLAVLLGSIWASSCALAVPAAVPGGVAATVVGKSIPISVLDHWIFVAGKSSGAHVPGQPVIVPTEPPRFNHCIEQVRSKVRSLRHRSRGLLRRDCERLFDALAGEALGFLIQAHWVLDDAAARDIAITRQQVLRAFHKARRQEFPTNSEFTKFLRETGQTVSDILFRVRVELTITDLLGHDHGPAAGRAQKRLDARLRKRYRPQTQCARFYVIPDCGNSAAKRPRPGPPRGFAG